MFFYIYLFMLYLFIYLCYHISLFDFSQISAYFLLKHLNELGLFEMYRLTVEYTSREILTVNNLPFPPLPLFPFDFLRLFRPSLFIYFLIGVQHFQKPRQLSSIYFLFSWQRQDWNYDRFALLSVSPSPFLPLFPSSSSYASSPSSQ